MGETIHSGPEGQPVLEHCSESSKMGVGGVVVSRLPSESSKVLLDHGVCVCGGDNYG